MGTSDEFILFKKDGKKKKLSSLFEDIYENSAETKTQISVFLKELSQFINNADEAREMVPIIKEYLEISVKNDEQLIKLAGIAQKIIQVENKAKIDDSDGIGFTDEDKKKLMEDVKIDFEDLKKGTKEIQKELDAAVDVKN